MVPELLALGLKECGPELMDAGLDAFFLRDGMPEGYEETDEFNQFFIPWFVYEFINHPDDPERTANAPHESLGSLYLRHHDERLSSIERAFLESAIVGPVSFGVVERTVPGYQIALRDLLTGATVVVRDGARPAL